MSEPLLNIDETQFEAAMVELSARPELFDSFSDDNITCQLATGYLVFDCRSIPSTVASEDVCKKHLCYLLSNQRLRNDLTAVLFRQGAPTRSAFQTVAQLMIQLAFQRYLMHQSMVLPSLVVNTVL